MHPGASFPDLAYDDLVAAAIAAAPAIESAATQPLGDTILAAVEASRAAARSNANLGILLLVAPLAAVPPGSPPTPAGADAVLARVTPTDAAAIWRALSIAGPGGMGTSAKWDVAGPPPDDILAAMRLAVDRDQIARLWVHGYAPLFAGPVADLRASLAAGASLWDAIVTSFLAQLAREPDSLVARRHGLEVARRVSAHAAEVLAAPPAARADASAAFDASLRQPLRINPGTTADMVAAALYILLAAGELRLQSGATPPAFHFQRDDR